MNTAARSPLLLHEIFARTAARHPDAPAVEVPGTSAQPRIQLTYREIAQRADLLAKHLAPRLDRSPGGGGEAIVALALPRRNPWLYAAQLAVLQAGGAYTCLEPGAADDAIRYLLDDSQAVVVVTEAALVPHLTAAGAPPARLLLVDALPEAPPLSGLPDPHLSPDRLCYVIYTSGTTGRPKGVLVEHRSIVSLVLSDVSEFGLEPGDRVAQSSSAAYDSSLEEIWLAFASGATLVVLDDDVVRLGPDLVPWLRDERIGVLCPPPTLLRMCACDDPAVALPDLHLLYVGGEELPADLAERWARGRRMVNGYGPTECTVTAVRGEVRPGEPVTIGTPVPGVTAWVLDDSLQEVPAGAEGELCLGGACLARGYLHQPALTAEKFVVHPQLGRLYRTGDRVRRLPSGEVAYLGRTDAQVKIRGHRIELGAVESALAACRGVRAAACKVMETGAGAKELVAFLVADPAVAVALADVRSEARVRLSEPMQPARLAWIAALPLTATSGKLDRAALPDLPPETPDRPRVAPRTPGEEAVARAVANHLAPGTPLSVDDDFFFDLGGNSLLAAQVISTLRGDDWTAGLTVRDLYETRTVAALATRLAPRRGSAEAPGTSADGTSADDRRETPGTSPGTWRRKVPGTHPLRTATLQVAFLLARTALASLVAYGVAFELLPVVAARLGALGDVGGLEDFGFLLLAPLCAIGALALYVPLALLAAVAAKKVLIGRYTPGRHPYLGGFYLRHWIVLQFARALPWDLVAGSGLPNLFLRALGARIGRGVYIHRGVDLRSGGWDLLSIGDGATLGREASLGMVDYDARELVLGPVTVGRNSTLDTRARMAPDTILGDGAVLTALSTLAAGSAVPADEEWHGVPAVRRGPAAPAPTVSAGRAWHPALYGALLLATRSLAAEAALVPLMILMVIAERTRQGVTAHWMEALYSPNLSGMSAAGPILVVLGLLVLGFFLVLPVQALIVRSLGVLKPGTSPLHGRASLTFYVKESVVEAAGNALSGTLFWPHWLRLAGMKIGRKCEISTLLEVVPELVEIGDECFFADGIYLGRPWLHRGTLTLGRTRFGAGTFLGNHVVVPAGADLPPGILVGISTFAEPGPIRPGSSWFGHPAFELPRREIVASERRLTHDPAWYRYLTRVFWESLRSFVPLVPALLGILWYKALPHWRTGEPPAEFFALTLPAATLAVGAALAGFGLAAKWLLLGKVRAGRHPLWSCWCSRWDFLYVVWAAYIRGTMTQFEGTPVMSLWLRAMGAKIGRWVVLGISFAQVVDPDMLEIGDGATVSCLLQLHSFEDRVLKIAPSRIGAGATVGHGAVLLYGANLGDGCRVEDGSVIMKHETLLPGRTYVGCPTRPVGP